MTTSHRASQAHSASWYRLRGIVRTTFYSAVAVAGFTASMLILPN